MVAVAAVNPAPAVDHDVGTIGADDARHFSEDRVAPDFFCFFGSFRVSEIRRASKEEFYAVSARCREQFLRADQSKLRRLLRPKVILSAFAASESEKRHIRVQAACEIGEQSR